MTISTTPDLTLYVPADWDSPYALSAFVALREKGLAFVTQPVKLDAGEQFSAGYSARSLTARVPCLDHAGFSLSESSAIAEYLEEGFPPESYPRLYPAPREARARARQLQAFLRSDFLALRAERPTASVFFAPARLPLTAAGTADADKLRRVAAQLIPADAGPLFGSWTIADVDFATMLQRLLANEEALDPRVRHYVEAQWARASVAEYVAKTRG
jgi:glutathione S-transferase